jgi:flagellar secretion chaperone FliS
MSYAPAQHAAYRRGAVLAASPAQLVVIAFDGARRFLRQGAAGMRAGEVETSHLALRHAEQIIGHLDGTLDFDQGELPQRLHEIYAFCMRHLNAARMNLDADKVDQVNDMLGELRDAFSQVADEAERA